MGQYGKVKITIFRKEGQNGEEGFLMSSRLKLPLKRSRDRGVWDSCNPDQFVEEAAHGITP